MVRYRVVILPGARKMFARHVQFLARINKNAAKSLRGEFSATVKEIQDNPLLFPLNDLDVRDFRKALFGNWYKIIYCIRDHTIYIEAVADCRMNPDHISNHFQ